MRPLFRYFSEQGARAFLDRGEIWLRPLSYFRDYEDEGVRADQHEGTLVHLPKDGLKAKMLSGQEIPTPYTFEATAREDDIFIYCASTELSADIAERFGVNVAVEIFDPVKFLARMRSAMSLRARLRVEKLVCADVRYYEWHEPPIADWAVPEKIALRKPRSFEWQKEYRFAVPVGSAFEVGKVEVRLVPVGTRRDRQALPHPKIVLRLGVLSKICRLHQF